MEAIEHEQVDKPEQQVAVHTMMTVDDALARLSLAFVELANVVYQNGGTAGELRVALSLEGRMDQPEKHKARISLRHYNYGEFDSKDVSGLQWNESVDELIRRLGRDNSLKRLEAPRI